MSSREWETLIDRHLDGVATSEEVAQLCQRLESDALARLTYLRLARIHATLAADVLDEPSMHESENRIFDLMERLDVLDKRRRSRRLVLSVAAAAAVVVLIAGVYSFRPRVDSHIATITSIDGAIRWTGDGGRVTNIVKSGQQLTGGTLESLAVDSSVELEFLDGSTVTISGLSILTISDDGQKKLHLREGNLSAAVKKQKKDMPLLVVTPAANLEVLGTQFDVTTDQTRTEITVNEGLVRATRLTDGEQLEISAGQRAVASIEERDEWLAREVEERRHVWQANLSTETKHGKWLSAAIALRIRLRAAINSGRMTEAEAKQEFFRQVGDFREDEGFVRAMPMRINGDVIYLVAVDVGRGKWGGATLVEGSRFRFQGRVKQPADVKFGFSAIDRDGASGARYTKSFAHNNVEESFDVVVPIEQFHSGSDVEYVSSLGRELVNVFCFTSLSEAELEITNMELLAP